jgi:hypothetical protein
VPDNSLTDERDRRSDAFYAMVDERRAYYHAAFVNLATALPSKSVEAVKSWNRHDGEPCYPETAPGARWFVVTTRLRNGDQVTQHYPEHLWDAFHIPEKINAPKWDGHDLAEGNRRLREFLGLREESDNATPCETGA